ncbi:hypothetical protein NBRC110019_01940 [Neptunitalea chrysea]|uniref:DUF4252 domain-containing protein n=1 Tax=Neptunitalea chrysea TaxID=1647581 RepID=A0A9W6ET53_9FLAO|nr:DUF4252 domain-containing protein [Neptunitalea chrysea]GLB51155.1 hypothetical protein NBRC110019_01940 [Neptunitalea chrysea]
MKKVLLLMVSLFVLVACGTKTPYQTFRNENKEAIDFSLNVSSFIGDSIVEKAYVNDLKRVVSGIRKYRVVVAKSNTSELNIRFKKLVNSKTYEQLAGFSNNGGSVELYFYKKGGKIKEAVCKIKNNDNFVVLSAEGNLKIKDLGKLVEEIISAN